MLVFSCCLQKSLRSHGLIIIAILCHTVPDISEQRLEDEFPWQLKVPLGAAHLNPELNPIRKTSSLNFGIKFCWDSREKLPLFALGESEVEGLECAVKSKVGDAAFHRSKGLFG